MLVEFLRAIESSDYDDEDIETRTAPIKINPVCVGAVFEATTPGIVIIRLSDGRGFKVAGTYADVTEKLEAAGRAVN